MEPSILLIIPCYNEASRLPKEDYKKFLSDQSQVKLLFVNDGSTDNTNLLLDEIKKGFPEKVTVLSIDKNVGKAEAIRQGVHYSVNSDVEYIGYFDADLATPLSEAIRMAAVNKSIDKSFLMGARVDLYGSTHIKRNIFRHYFGRIFATIISNLLNLSIYDTQCGAKLIKKNTAIKLFEEAFISKWLFDIELILRLKKECGKDSLEKHLGELSLIEWKEKGSSKVSWLFLFKIPFDIVAIFTRY